MPRIHQQEETVPMPFLMAQAKEAVMPGKRSCYLGAVAQVQEHTPKHETQQEDSRGINTVPS